MSLFSKLTGIFATPGQGTQPSPTGRPLPQPQPIRPVQQKHQVPQKQVVQPKQAQPSQPVPSPHAIQDDTSIREAQARAREIIVEAKDEALQLREKAEREVRQLRQEVLDKERAIEQNLVSIDGRLKLLDERDKELERKKHRIIERVHGPISHLLFFVPLGINSSAISLAVLRDAVGKGDLVLSALFLIATVGGSLFGVGIALEKVKLPYY